MSKCINNDIGKKLYLYELGKLSGQERDEFEIHLIECEYCSKQAAEFGQTADFIRNDPGAREIVKEVLEFDEAKGRSKAGTLKLYYLIAAVIIVVALLPLYKYVLMDKGEPFTQTINLFPLRFANQQIIELSRGGDVIINFVYDSAVTSNSYKIYIISRDHDTVYVNEKFSAFNSAGSAAIILPASQFSPGYYTLKIVDSATEVRISEKLYIFQAK
jgi:hypothetical protein